MTKIDDWKEFVENNTIVKETRVYISFAIDDEETRVNELLAREHGDQVYIKIDGCSQPFIYVRYTRYQQYKLVDGEYVPSNIFFPKEIWEEYLEEKEKVKVFSAMKTM